MGNRILLYDRGISLSTDELGMRILTEPYYYPVYQTTNLSDLIINIIKALYTNNEICLVDPHFTLEEIRNCGLEPVLNQAVAIRITSNDIELLLSELYKSFSEISIFTSGTTGIPKKITHTTNKLFRNLKLSDILKSKIWGLTYNPTHMAGLQVMFQALCTESTLVNLYLINEKQKIFETLEKYKISMISATPTFYRMMMPTEYINETVHHITLGGEKADIHIITRLKQIFPKARIRNVYATTESGSLFSAENDIFIVRNDRLNDIKIVDNELFIKAYLLGNSTDIEIQDSWYRTGDVVEIISENPLRFKFISRVSSIINVGGNKVDPYEVEDAIREMPGIKEVKVYAKTNSVTGNLICCEVLKNGNTELDEKQIISYLRNKLADYKIPRIVKFVESIEVTRTGKIKRSN